VLSFSSLNANGSGVMPVYLDEVIEDIKSDLELVIAQTGATITNTGLPKIEGVPVQLHQLCYNLVNNSLKFSRAGVAPEITISSEVKDNGDGQGAIAVIQVQDNGIGFEQ